MELADSRERENTLQKKYQEQAILISGKTKEVKFISRSSNNSLLYFLILFIQDTNLNPDGKLFGIEPLACPVLLISLGIVSDFCF